YSGTYSLDVAEPVLTPIASIPENYSVTFFGVEESGPVIIDGNNQRRGFQYDYSGGSCPDSQPNDGIDTDIMLNFANLNMVNCWVIAYLCGSTNQGQGGAVKIVNDPAVALDVSFRNCRFEDNFIDDPQFINNNGRSVAGAGIYINGRAANNGPLNEARVVIDSCYFTNNQANQIDNGGHGGAVYILNANEATITNSFFCENSVYSEMADDGDLNFDRNGGGAVHILDTYTGANPHAFLIENCYFVGNNATTADGASLTNQSEGGAVFLHRGDGISNTTNSTLTIGNSAFYNNFIETGIEHVDNSSGTIDLTSIGNNVFEDEFAIQMANDTTICDSVLIGVLNPIPGAEYDWSNGMTGATTQINESGMYSVTVTLGNCSTADTIDVTVVPCVEECDNGIDDDGDGLVDCCDPDLWDDPCCEGFPILNLGPDTAFICDNGVLEVMADSGFVSYMWQDGWPEPSYTIYAQGTYWVTVEDSICGTLSDTITVLDDPETIARVTPEFETICPGEQVTYEVDPVFDTYLWIPDDFLSCSDCPNPTSTPEEAISYIFIGGFDNGCYSVDTVFINIQIIETSENITICEGESVEIFGEQISTPGAYSETFTSVDGCDSTHTVSLANYAAPSFDFDDVAACSNLDNGSLTVEIIGGTAPYSYQWSVAGAADAPTLENVGAGSYAVTIIDGNNCTFSSSGSVTTRTTEVDVLSTNSGCLDECLATITVVPNTNQDFAVSLVDGTPFDGLVLSDVCAGVYDLVLTDQADGCEYSETTLVTSFPTIEINAPTVVEVLEGDTVQLEVTVVANPPLTYSWSPAVGLSCTDCPNPLAFPAETTLYTLNVTDGNGCANQVEVRVNVSVDCDDLNVQIPNIFSPGNNDGLNDTFGPLLGDENLVIRSFNIYNRFGQNVYSVEGQYVPWNGLQNGGPAPADTYAYLIEIDCSGIITLRSGEVTLLR
ncbi:MAG: gliding motility-associated C-terminal domain-containing protein, partial [Bacteroidota bacterium]